MDVLKRIRDLMQERNWSEKDLSIHSGVPQTTINSWYQRNHHPSISTLEDICRGFDISMSDFFNDSRNTSALTNEQMEMFEKWSTLTKKQKEAIMNLINSI